MPLQPANLIGQLEIASSSLITDVVATITEHFQQIRDAFRTKPDPCSQDLTPHSEQFRDFPQILTQQAEIAQVSTANNEYFYFTKSYTVNVFLNVGLVDSKLHRLTNAGPNFKLPIKKLSFYFILSIWFKLKFLILIFNEVFPVQG
jgi:hypothetical protein